MNVKHNTLWRFPANAPDIGALKRVSVSQREPLKRNSKQI